MISLKAFLPVLSKEFGLSEAALYERQRALVRLGLLPQPMSRGRNSGGAMATPEAVGLMLIAVLATDNLSEIDERVLKIANSRTSRWNDPTKPAVCHFTNKRVLKKAVAAAISDADISVGLSLEISRNAQIARLVDMSGERLDSEFGERLKRPPIELKAVYTGLFTLAVDLDLADRPGFHRGNMQFAREESE